MDNPCSGCGCWDSEREGCTMPSVDRGYACKLEESKEPVKVVKIAQATPFRYNDVSMVYDMWDDDEVVECVLHSAMVMGQSVSYMMDVFEQQFRSIDRLNTRAIAELHVLLLMRGWY